MDAVLKALQVSAPTLLGLPNVVGVGRGDKFVKGESTGRPAVTVLVKQKLPKDALQACDLVPMSIADAYTDVIEVGEVVALGVPSLAGPNITRTERHRPAMPGVSAGHYKRISRDVRRRGLRHQDRRNPPCSLTATSLPTAATARTVGARSATLSSARRI